MWIERASGWLVSCLSQFQGWNIPIQFGVWRGHSDISLRFNGVFISRCKLQGNSWFLLLHPILSTISSFSCIFLLMEGLCFGWDIVLFERDYHGTYLIVISLIYYFLHIHKVLGRNTKWLYVKVIINKQTMTISPTILMYAMIMLNISNGRMYIGYIYDEWTVIYFYFNFHVQKLSI